jgi:hypothetical protein
LEIIFKSRPVLNGFEQKGDKITVLFGFRKENMKRFLIILVLSVLFLTSCAPEYQQNISKQTNLQDSVYRFVDNEANVVCWVYHYGYKGGISCLPISETSLKK